MFENDEFIYVQMHKTGCTHITSILSDFLGGEQTSGHMDLGKHNPVTPNQLKDKKLFISSIRNPWEWYLSLWTYGVQGNGKLMLRLTQRNFFRTVVEAFKNPRINHKNLTSELFKNIRIWRALYNDSGDIYAFRKWLKLIHAPSNCCMLGERYGDTMISDWCGFMTYRYLYLCCFKIEQLYDRKSIQCYADLVQFEKDNCYIEYFIRQENLAGDVCSFIEKFKHLSQTDKANIYEKKRINKSKRSLLISDYYDQTSVDLVYERDRLLVEKFNYSPPNIAK